MVDISGKLDKLSGALGQKLLISNTDGTITESGYGIQTEGVLTDSTSDLAVNKVIYDALAKKIDAVAGTENNIVVFGVGKTIKDSAKAVGGDKLKATVDANTVATEAAVKAAIDEALEWSTIG